MLQLTNKQEAFAIAVASGKNQSDAYRHAYNASKMKATSVNVNGSKLMAKANIKQRVKELREPIVEKALMTLETHLRDLMMLRNMAAKANQIGAAINAEIARGKAAGVNIERSEMLMTTKALPSSVDEFV